MTKAKRIAAFKKKFAKLSKKHGGHIRFYQSVNPDSERRPCVHVYNTSCGYSLFRGRMHPVVVEAMYGSKPKHWKATVKHSIDKDNVAWELRQQLINTFNVTIANAILGYKNADVENNVYSQDTKPVLVNYTDL